MQSGPFPWSRIFLPSSRLFSFLRFIIQGFRRIVNKDVDKSEVISPNHIESPVLGGMTAKQLSGGVKTLLLALNKPELFLNASTGGDNCAKWLLEIGKINNVKVNLGHIMEFGDDGFEFYCENTGTVIHNIDEMFEVTDEYL